MFRRSIPTAILSLSALLSASGCVVPQNRYDVAVSRLDGERANREHAEAELQALKEKLTVAQAALKKREQALSAEESELSQAKLDVDKAGLERDDAAMLVEQLRGELGRVGDHLRDYSQQKQELETALADAEARAKKLDQVERQAATRVLVMRDLSLSLGEAVSHGIAVVTVVDGNPTVRVDASRLFTGTEIDRERAGVLQKVSEVLLPRMTLKVELSDLSSEAATPEDRIVKLQRCADVMTDTGLSLERIGFAVPPAESAPAGASAGADPAPSSGEAAKGEPGSPPGAEDTTTPGSPKSREAAPSDSAWREGPGSVQIVVQVDAA